MHDENNISRKERERIHRKSDIRSAAQKLFAEKGFHSTTLDEIAEAAEFGKGTIYNYFLNKDEILLDILTEVSFNARRIIEEADEHAESFLDFLALHIKGIFTYVYGNPHGYVLFVRELTSYHFEHQILQKKEICDPLAGSEEIMKRRFEQGIAENLFITSDCTRLLMMYSHIVYPYVFEMIHKQLHTETDPVQEAEMLLRVFLHGLIRKQTAEDLR